MFAKNNTVFVFGQDEDSRDSKKNVRDLVLQTLSDDAGGEPKRLRIKCPVAGPSPFSIIDLNLTFSLALLVDVRGDPGSSLYYVYSLDSGNLERVSLPKHDVAFFLSDDVLASGPVQMQSLKCQ